MWKLLNVFKISGMEAVYKAMQAEVDGIDLQ
jgi:hypothetical protein